MHLVSQAAPAPYPTPPSTTPCYYTTTNAILVSYPALTLSPPQAPAAAALKAKREFLATAGVLQAAAPEATQFVVLASAPLPEELSTTVQVRVYV